MRALALTALAAIALAAVGCSEHAGTTAATVAPATTLATAAAAAAPAAAPTVAEDWLWPLAGDVLAGYDPAHPLGIDIAAAPGTPVHAARSGLVVFAGGATCCDTGLHVIIDHGGGLETVYARLAAMIVVPGQSVARGDVIGDSGETGTEGAAAPHLHFEVRRGNVFQNPLLFLRGAPVPRD